MASTSTGFREGLKINDLDWEILEVMSDGLRYTPVHLYRDVEELEEYGDDWIRRRIKNLNDNGLIDRVGSSSMYEISDWGLAALTLRDELEDADPKQAMQSIIERAGEMSIRRRGDIVDFEV